MLQIPTKTQRSREPWNKVRLIGQQPALKRKRPEKYAIAPVSCQCERVPTKNTGVSKLAHLTLTSRCGSHWRRHSPGSLIWV
ncbi:MAG: hypothetical protein ACI9W2_003043 [Gammaproteobacteria bacterium]|jgi:hypothetical protein